MIMMIAYEHKQIGGMKYRTNKAGGKFFYTSRTPGLEVKTNYTSTPGLMFESGETQDMYE